VWYTLNTGVNGLAFKNHWWVRWVGRVPYAPFYPCVGTLTG
jgi:hypothetical protein